jgi:UDP:flavonoid glycosyltransferase YjiC (YdhE family)
MLSISCALVARGHRVTWITGRRFAGRIQATGADFRPLPLEIDPGKRSMCDLFPEAAGMNGWEQSRWFLRRIFLGTAARQVEAIEAVLEELPVHVLVGDATMLGVYLAAERNGIPSVMVSVGPLAIPSRDTAPFGLGLLPENGPLARARNRLLNWLGDRLLVDLAIELNLTRADVGLPPLRTSFSRSEFESPQIVLQLSTPAFEYPRSDLPANVHFVGPILPADQSQSHAPSWWAELAGPRPTVLIAPGTGRYGANGPVIPVVHALRDEMDLLVVAPVDDAVLPLVPSNLRTESSLPLGRLLFHADAMVSDGSYSDVQMALAHGVPVVVQGVSEDRIEVARRLQWSGAGLDLGSRRASPGRIRDAVREVVGNPSYRRRAQQIQDDFLGYNAPKQSAELLEGLTWTRPMENASVYRVPLQVL